MTETEHTAKIGESRIEELADKHGIDRDQVRELVDAGATECMECGRDEGEILPIHSYVVGDDETARLCHECYAQYLADVTILSDGESRVWALYAAGMDATAITDKLGTASGQSNTAIRRSHQKLQDAREKLPKLEATIALIEGGDA